VSRSGTAIHSRLEDPRAAFVRGDLDGAWRDCRCTLLLAPGDPEALHLLGMIYGQIGGHKEAALCFARALCRSGNNADFHIDLGAALYQAGMIDRAAAAIRRAIALHPDNGSGLHNHAFALQNAGKKAAAATVYRRVIAVSPAAVEARRNLSMALNGMGETAAAISLMQQLVSESPRRLDFVDNLAQVLLDGGKTMAAANFIAEAALLRHAPHASTTLPAAPGHEVTATKLRHDIEQLDHLQEHGRASPWMKHIRKLYAEVLADAGADVAPAQPLTPSPSQARKLIASYGRRYARSNAAKTARGTLNPALDFADIQRRYLGASPELVVIDNLLTAEALSGLQRFCQENSFWIRSYGGGYLGAFMEDGFFCPLLAEVADELRARMSEVLAPHTLKKAWGFKYDSDLSGINLHADFAAVNVNFWITPDEANLDPSSGGLVVWDKPAPLTWTFAEYNASPELSRPFLVNAGARHITIPYRCNRAVIFNSNLFHETDRIAFRRGYLNRRVNITLLYGLRS
jgi:Flp pilus assembly protein TadD